MKPTQTFLKAVFLLSLLHVWDPQALHSETFSIGKDEFLLDGESFQIRSGEMHYSRIPKEYWRNRIQMAKAMGLNTISTYVFWNLHEPKPGEWDFSGDKDVAEFCRIAQQEGMKVILRPGPYVCAEWDMGGLPSWLLTQPHTRIRERNISFIGRCETYFAELAKQVSALQITRGGPILMVQVENEYDAYGSDSGYIGDLIDILRDVGFDVPVFSSESAWSIKPSPRPELFRSIGVGKNPQEDFGKLLNVQPDKPLFGAEVYTGWYDRWGETSRYSSDNPEAIVNTLKWMFDHNASFNLYMAHGGTTFGLNSGANGSPYSPATTSYDYGAPISEAGWVTPKFLAIRDLIQANLPPGTTLPPIPATNATITLPPVQLTEFSSIWDSLPEPHESRYPQPMESYGQNQGCIVYRTTLPAGQEDWLLVEAIHDFGWVYLDGKFIGVLERGRSRKTIPLPARESRMRLDVLVEAMGRVHYGRANADSKGLIGSVSLRKGRNLSPLLDWQMFPIPLSSDAEPSRKFQSMAGKSPGFLKGSFSLTQTGDVFLDMSNRGKGAVWINGRCLGRYWNLGPHQTLYCPAPWLRSGFNTILVLDLENNGQSSIRSLAEPTLNDLNFAGAGRVHGKGQSIDLTTIRPNFSGLFGEERRWQKISFPPQEGRFICLETLSSHPGDAYASCAELGLLGTDGQALHPEGWRVIYTDSQEVIGEDGYADNILDNHTQTHWHTGWLIEQPPHPHYLVIDLGKKEKIAGIQYLARQDQTKNGTIYEFNLYISEKIFPGISTKFE